ncbi:MAG: sigma-70 family RNA polymerase sigma factor [Rickettsiales bacterium]
MTEKQSNTQSLEELMKKAQSGDSKAYNKLLRSITPIIKGFLYNKIGNGVDNEEILQEILLAIHKSSHTYNTDRSFKAWMFAIADYKVKDYLRAYYRKSALIKIDFNEIEHSLADNVTKSQESSELLNDALSILPEKQQKIVSMMKIEGYSAKEVAAEMDMSVSAVKVSAHRAYNILIEKNKKGEL